MINVYSFQKIMSEQHSAQPKNISKTSHFTFGQNYRKIVSNSKGSFDFRKFLQKNHLNKKSLASKDQSKRNPLQQVSTLQSNIQSNLQSKAFKIRCYSRRHPKQNDRQEQEQIVSKFIRNRPKLYEKSEKKLQSTSKKCKSQNIKTIKMHKFDNFQELQSISSSIKAHYNDFMIETDKLTERAIIFDLNYIVSCMKSNSNLKQTEKQRQLEFHRKKFIYLLKRIIDQKYFVFPLDRTTHHKSSLKPQIIFKVQTQQQIPQLLKQFQECQFNSFYSIFCIQNKYIQSINVYNLTKLKDLAQNIVMIDQFQNIFKNIPLLNSRHFISFLSFSQKCNFIATLQNTFSSLDNLDIRFTAEQFQLQQTASGQNKSLGQLIEIPTKKLIQKAKQKQILKNCRKTSRQKKQRCQSSYESSYIIQQKRQQRYLQNNYKQKLLKWLKIEEIQRKTNFNERKSKQLSSVNSQQFECMTGRQVNSKTNYQLVSELIRLNSHIQKQITNYQRKMLDIQIETQQTDQINCLRFQKIYLNVFS